MRRHGLQMLVAGAGVLVLLVVLGVDVGEAVLWALLLACPLMMIWMMRHGHDGHGTAHDRADLEAQDRGVVPEHTRH